MTILFASLRADGTSEPVSIEPGDCAANTLADGHVIHSEFHVPVARSASRSVLGFMNDMASTSAHVAAQSGGVTHVDVGQLNAFLRRKQGFSSFRS